jgi:phosphate transport system permease protein
MARNHSKSMKKTGVTVGEPFVWLSGVGLAVGLLMVVGLLILIVVKGVDTWWPHRVAQVQLVAGSPDALAGSEVIGGEITRDQEKAIRTVDADGKTRIEHEIQLFVGNKDAYGFSFKFIDRDQIQAITDPVDVVRIDRMEYGPAFGFPVSIKTPAGVDDAGSAQFDDLMRRLTDEAVARRNEIGHIEENLIGHINYEMDDLAVERRGIERRHGDQADPAELKAIDDQSARLQTRYEDLAKQARELRELQSRDTITYRLFTGEQRTIPFGNIVDYYYPNRLSLLQRVGLFLHNLWVFLSTEPRESNTEGGIFPAIFGTFVMTVMMSLAVTPFGVLAAIYLREYAKDGALVRIVRIAINNLAGVPSIVFGVFGLGFFVYVLGGSIDTLLFADRLPAPTFGTGGMIWAALTLALMTVPVVIVATEESLASVSRGIREGSLACGASKWQTIQRVVLPAAAPGIITGMILAMARGAGEVAPLMLVGVVKLAPSMPIDSYFPFVHLERKFMHLGFHIYDLGFQSPDSEAARPMVFATTMLLILLVVLMNFGAIILRERLRRKYTAGAF